MSTQNVNNFQKHITFLSVFYIGMSLVGLSIAVFVFLLLSTIGIAVGDDIALQVLLIVGTSVLCVLLVTSIPSLIAGIGLLARRQWGRILALIMAVFKLFNIPIGTAVGIYSFWVLLQDEADIIFSADDPSLTGNQYLTN